MRLLRKLPIYYGWWILASSIVIISLQGMAVFGFPVFYSSLIDTFGWGRTEIILGSTIFRWVFGAMSLLSGVIIDKRGVRVVLLSGSILVATAYLLFTRMTALWQLYAIAIIFGVGLAGMAYMPNQYLQSRWFSRRRGLAIGIVNAASALGGVVAPILISFLMLRMGWRGAMGIIDILIWTLPLMLIIFVIKEKPEDIGLNPDGSASAITVKKEGQSSLSGSASAEGFREIFTKPVFWILMGSLFFAGGTVGTTLDLLILYLRDTGFSGHVAASVLSLELWFSFLGRLVFGGLSDRYSVRKMGVMTFVLLGIAPVMLFAINVPGVVIAFAVLHGLGHGGVISFKPLILAEAFGAEKNLGRLFAIGQLAYLAGVGCLPVIISFVFDRTGSYSLGFSVNIVMTLFAAAAIMWARRYLRQPTSTPMQPVTPASELKNA
jgi:MFS family permease